MADHGDAPRTTEPRDVALDVLRFAAALLVLCEHARAATFVPYEAVASHRLLLAPFYALTSMGHEAVMVFFALSGYLVGGQVVRRIRGGRWSFTEYAVRRLTRLWIVVVPALAATFLVDHAMMAAGYGGLYDGAMAQIPSLPRPEAPAAYDLATLVGNVLFLQEVVVPVYGSNGPLWSLSYEFWYYVIFPAAVWAGFARAGIAWRLAALAVAIALAASLPAAITRLGLVWLAGAAAAVAQPAVARWRGGIALWTPPFAVLLITAVLLVAVQPSRPLDDLVVGLLIAAALPFLSTRTALPFGPAAMFGAEMSFTLYLFHFPVVVALAGLLALPERFAPSPLAFALYAGLVGTVLSIAAGLWFCFERHTAALYRAAMRLATTVRQATAGSPDKAGGHDV